VVALRHRAYGEPSGDLLAVEPFGKSLQQLLLAGGKLSDRSACLVLLTWNIIGYRTIK
jgi:hypothetical protein